MYHMVISRSPVGGNGSVLCSMFVILMVNMSCMNMLKADGELKKLELLDEFI